MNDPAPIAREAPLDYATPETTRPISVGRLLIGLIATVLVGVGGGFIVFGGMVAARMREQAATLVAIGATLVVMGIGVVASWLFARAR